jgi:SulP family sulfate permease
LQFFDDVDVSADVPGLLQRDGLKNDIIAGITGAVAGIPQAMAFAIIAGVSPIYGLYAAVVATIIAGFTTNAPLMTVSPTNALALAAGSVIAQRANGGVLEYLVTLTVLIGLFQLIVGMLQLGRLTRFVSNAVMTGFISGAGLLIVLGQLSNLTGISAEGSNPLFSFADWATHLAQLDPRTTLIGIGSILLLVILNRTPLESFSLLLMLLVSAGVVWVLGWQDVRLVQDISLIPASVPNPMLPNLNYAPDLVVPAIAIGILGLVQSAGVAQSIKEETGANSNISRDFVGQGLANIAGGIMRGMPSGGSISRTAVNIQSGAQTRLANILAGVLIALSMVLFGGLIEQIPLAALAGLLIVSAVNLIDMDDIRTVWQTYPPARLAMTATFASTLVLPLEYSIYIGMILSVLLYLKTSSRSAHLVQLVPTDDGGFIEVDPPETLDKQMDAPLILTIYGDPYFGAVQSLAEQFPFVKDASAPTIILRMRGLDVVGSTFLVLLRDYAAKLRENGGHLVLTGVSEDLAKELDKARLHDLISDREIFRSEEKLLKSTKKALNVYRDAHPDNGEDDSNNDDNDRSE